MGKKKKAIQKWIPTPGESKENSPITLAQIEDRLMKAVLGGTLALHLLRNCKKPASELLQELFEIEHQVGQFVGAAIQTHAHTVDTHGALAGALSFITLALADDVPLAIVMENVGHAQLSTTDRYFSSSGIKMRGQMDRLQIQVPQENEGVVVPLSSVK